MIRVSSPSLNVVSLLRPIKSGNSREVWVFVERGVALALFSFPFPNTFGYLWMRIGDVE
jgi:hypothetical protein